MVELRRFKEYFVTVVLYEFSGQHTPAGALRWMFHLAETTGNPKASVYLDNSKDINLDNSDGITIPVAEGFPAVLKELKHRDVDALSTFVKLNGCVVCLTIHLDSYILTISVDNKDAEKIDGISKILSKVPD